MSSLAGSLISLIYLFLFYLFIFFCTFSTLSLCPRLNEKEASSCCHTVHPSSLFDKDSVCYHLGVPCTRCGLGVKFNLKVLFYQYKKSHYGNKTIYRPSYLRNVIPYTGKTVSWYWIGGLIAMYFQQKHALNIILWCSERVLMTDMRTDRRTEHLIISLSLVNRGYYGFHVINHCRHMVCANQRNAINR